MGSADALLAQLRAQRRHWLPALVDEASGLRVEVQMSAPTQFEVAHLLRLSRDMDGDGLALRLGRVIVDWRGVTEATLLGAGIGTDEPAPYSAELWAALVADRPALVRDALAHAVRLADEQAQRIRATAGN